ncbi:glycerophosphodiester phosphodiesterase family protein [Allosalinactinospora lopnorensis]|uniref:glycerophosphodiester phosphodiesterase family protein n=1 Tax=Allosalinactinospora lopnorensis TaxID=1352348 RepID=UPI0009E2F2D8|nr:glycerophosphodiester phosphodiesterase family protein [Allosalinactinospora lopnorensis]
MPLHATTPRRTPLTALLIALLAGTAPAVAETRTPDSTDEPAAGERSIVEPPWVIAHRGASAYRPEHTLPAYGLAVRQRADFIEPDLVPTSDGHLVARHENELSDTTDVADRPEFADRETTKTIDGNEVTGWFSEDFTLEEIKTLRAVERIPDIRPGNTKYDGRYEVATFEEVLDLREKYLGKGIDVQVMPELKHPGYFDSIGLDTEEMMAAALEERGLTGTGEDAPVFVQSFEPASLRELNGLVEAPLVQLISTDQRELTTPEGLDGIAAYAEAIGPDLSLVLPIGEDGLPAEPTPLVADAHDRELLVTPWTLRSENAFLPDGYTKGDDPTRFGDYKSYYTAVLETGADGFFADSPDHLYKTRAKFLKERDK